MVPDSMKEDVNVQAEEKANDFDVNNSLDPFKLYPLLNKKKIMEEKMDNPAVGNSGGILCVWEKLAFKKNNSTISDYFVMIGGSWLCSGVNLLIISVYAPQEYA
nr:RNA-directed DNA polymerase, eukaryota [Tanacetum cinerariifolium]